MPKLYPRKPQKNNPFFSTTNHSPFLTLQFSAHSVRFLKMGEEGKAPNCTELVRENQESKNGKWGSWIGAPFYWLAMLSKELHWSFVFGVIVVYGIGQGLGGAIENVATEYYMKDVQKVQPSESQVYSGIKSIPWIVKPIWGLLTDVVPILGYHRRPYFVFAGMLGVVAMLFLSLYKNLHIVLALLSMTAASASAAIADVTVDACVAQKSGSHPSLAPNMQSLCTLSSSIGSLVGFALSGIFVHLIGPQGVYGLLIMPSALVLVVGVLLKEPRSSSSFAYEKIHQNFFNAGKSMWKTLKYPAIWRPCLYMYLSFSLGLNISEGMFYWFTDAEAGPSFSKQAIGYINAIGSVGALLGGLLYQYGLKRYPFRDLLFWVQILSCLAGMLDVVLVLRWNLKLGIPDYIFAVVDTSVSEMISCLKWMPLVVLSSKICPPGVEGTFFALLMSIDNVGLLTSSWLGGLLIHALSISRTRFDKLWLAVVIRNILRIVPLFLLFLIPRTDPNSAILPDGASDSRREPEARGLEDVELAAPVNETGAEFRQ